MTKTFALALALSASGCAYARSRVPPSEATLDAVHADCTDRLQRRSFIESNTPRRINTLPRQRDDGVVVIYGASWCRPCEWAKAYLTRRGVRFIEKDTDDESVRNEMNELLVDAAVWGHGIPVIVVRDVVMTGFMPCAIDEALNYQRS